MTRLTQDEDDDEKWLSTSGEKLDHRVVVTTHASLIAAFARFDDTARDFWTRGCILLGAVRSATGIFMLLEVIGLARPCESELLVGHGVGPDIAGRSR